MDKLHHILTCIFFLLVYLSTTAFGQEVPRIISFHKNQYKAYNQNWGITQSPEGLMYFANSAGLLEYDGAYWKTYPLPDKQILRSVVSDEKSKIFGGGYGEFGYWEADELGQLQYFSLRAQLQHEAAESEEIWNIVVDSQLVLFQSFSEVYAYDYQKVYQVEDPGLLLFIKKIGKQWVFPVMKNGLFSWTPEEHFESISTAPILTTQRVKALVEKSASEFWVATEREGIYLFQKDGHFSKWPTAVDQALKDFQINRVIQLQSGHLAIGTILNGLYIIDQEGQLVFHINQESGLQNNTILGLQEDQNGDLWLALDKGIDLILISQPLRFYPDVRGNLGTVYSAQLFQNQLYIGSNQGLYVKTYNKQEDFQLIEGTQGQVWDLFIYDDQLWGGHNNGTFLVSGNRIKWLSSVTGGWCTRMLPSQKDVLVQSNYTGFTIFKKIAGQWQFSNRVKGFQAPIKQFFFDEQNQVWALHSTEGLWRLQFNEILDSVQQIRTYTQDDGLPTTFGLDLNRIDGKLIIRADTSFFHWTPAAAKLLPLDSFRAHPLPKQRLSLLPGREDEWFLANTNRLHWYRNNTNLGDFSIQLVPNFEQVVAIDNQTYLFCLDDGYATLDISDVETIENKSPAPLITKLEVLRPSRRQIHPFRSIYQNAEVLELAPQERQIRFYYALPYFGEEIQYRYRLLSEADEWSEWSEWSELATAEFSSLEVGNYTLEVEANHSKHKAQQTFSILPHWYETTLAKVSYGLFALFLAFLFWRWHRFRLRKQREQLVREKEKQLEEERIRSRTEKLQEDVIRKSQELANSTFNLVRKNEILMQLKESLTTSSRTTSPQNNRQLIRLIDRHLTDEQDWKIFEINFNQVHEVFFKKLKSEYTDLTPGDLRLAAYLRMNLSSKEIAPLLNISLRGVENKRYRLRRKMALEGEKNLVDFLMQY